MLRKIAGIYYTCVMLSVIVLVGMGLYDYSQYVRNGEFALFPELNLAQFKSGDEALLGAAEYLEQLWRTGYSRDDFYHSYAKAVLNIVPFSSAIAIFIRLFGKNMLSKRAWMTILVSSIGTLLIVLLLHSWTQGTYAMAEVRFLYPIAYF